MSANGHVPPLRLRAESLMARCDGLEEAGMHRLAGETRYVARGLLETLDELGHERALRAALQARCEAQQSILGKAVYQACGEKAS